MFCVGFAYFLRDIISIIRRVHKHPYTPSFLCPRPTAQMNVETEWISFPYTHPQLSILTLTILCVRQRGTWIKKYTRALNLFSPSNVSSTITGQSELVYQPFYHRFECGLSTIYRDFKSSLLFCLTSLLHEYLGTSRCMVPGRGRLRFTYAASQFAYYPS